MKRLFAVLLTLCMLCASALADSLTTNGGVTLDTGGLPYCTEDEAAPAESTAANEETTAEETPVPDGNPPLCLSECGVHHQRGRHGSLVPGRADDREKVFSG